MMGAEERIVALIDMDCFYVQVEEREHPENKGKPACVVQYKTWKGGGIIAVNYEARAKGITRQMRGDEARQKCPEVILYRVPELRGKADLTKYRDAGKEVIDVLCQFGACVERASIDEAYLDLTEVVNKLLGDPSFPELISPSLMLHDTHVVGWSTNGSTEGLQNWVQSLKNEGMIGSQDCRLYAGAELVKKMRTAVKEKTGFQCSAGIAHNKMLAKLACGIYKPNKQTVLPMQSVEEFFVDMPLKKVRHLGGKLGDVLNIEMSCMTMKDVSNIPERQLQQKFDEKTGTWLYWYSRGVDHEPVTSRHLPKSIGCNKNFTGNDALDSKEKIEKWLEQLCSEVTERLERDKETNKRIAKQVVLSVRQDSEERTSSYTRSMLLPSYDKCKLVTSCLDVMLKKNSSKVLWNPPVTCIGVAATKFEDDIPNVNGKINRFFQKIEKPNPGEEDALETRDNDLFNFEKNQSVGNVKGKISHFFQKAEKVNQEVGNLETREKNINPEEYQPVENARGKISRFFQTIGKVNQDEEDVLETREKDIFTTEKYQPAEKKEVVEATKISSHSEEEATETPMNMSSKDFVEKKGFFASRQFSKACSGVLPSLNKGLLSDSSDSDYVESESADPGFLKSRENRTDQCVVFPDDCDDISNRFYPCVKCGKQLQFDEVQEHADYHMALELQQELSGPSVSNNVQDSVPSSVKTNLKRMRSKPESSRTQGKRCRTIESFFQRK